jgi:hypothetical protein
MSYCCADRECRKRATPPSVVFLSRRLYPFVVVLLVSALRDGSSERRLSRLRATIGVSPETVARWRTWWAEAFEREGHLSALRGFAVRVGGLRGLLRSFRMVTGRLLYGLIVLSPLSTLSVDRKLAWRWALRIRRGCYSVAF